MTNSVTNNSGDRRNFLRRKDILRGKNRFERLFLKGRKIHHGNLSVVFYFPDDEVPGTCKVAFGVSRRIIRKAHDRNLVKRRLREAYRLNHRGFIDAITASGKTIHLMFIYRSRKIFSYKEIETDLVKLMEQLTSIING